jgi:hypothetical protein
LTAEELLEVGAQCFGSRRFWGTEVDQQNSSLTGGAVAISGFR